MSVVCIDQYVTLQIVLPWPESCLLKLLTVHTWMSQSFMFTLVCFVLVCRGGIHLCRPAHPEGAVDP